MIKLPKEVEFIIHKLEQNGFQCYAVGGCIRDLLLGIEPLDWDLATDAEISDMLTIFENAKVLNERYSVARIGEVDLATFRKESDFRGLGKPSTITFVSTISEDMPRRDFAINAIAYNPHSGFVDLYDGIGDLKSKVIRVIGDGKKRFEEDPVRILRGIRFVAEKGFKIEEETWQAMKNKAHLLNEIEIDKVREEYLKIVSGDFSKEGKELLEELDFYNG